MSMHRNHRNTAKATIQFGPNAGIILSKAGQGWVRSCHDHDPEQAGLHQKGREVVTVLSGYSSTMEPPKRAYHGEGMVP